MENREYRGWRVPTDKTLRRYGGTVDAWKAIIDRQGGVCPVCGRLPTTGRGVIDHEHVRGWRSLPPDRRWNYVRGVTCWRCNHAFLARGMTPERAQNIMKYLQDYNERKCRQMLGRKQEDEA